MSSLAPFFSIVLPVRNGAKYLAETLNSVFVQTYSNFNVLVLENQSEDNTLEILHTFRDERLQIFPSDKSLPIEENWQRILALPLAEWMTIISHDDLLYPDFLQEMIALMQSEPSASLYTSHFDIIDPDGHVTRRCRPIPYRATGEEFLQARQHYQHDSFGTGYVMRSQDFIRVGGLPPLPQLYYADDLAVYKLAQLSAKISSPKSLFAYRYHRRSAAYTVPLETLYQASKGYLLTLVETGYSANPAHAVMARKYIEKTFSRRFHRFLVDLILANNPAHIESYNTSRRQLFEWAQTDNLFSIYDPVSRLTEWFLYLPLPGVRRGMARLIELVGILTRKFRK